MNTRGFSAYNLARRALLNARLALAESGNQPLKLLDIVVSGMGMDPTAGLWLSPLHAVPAVPRVFPFDLIYLDKEYRVLDAAEMGPGIEFPLFHPEVTSALVLPPDTLHRTQTVSGDMLIVCLASELDSRLSASSLPTADTAESARQAGVSASAASEEPVQPTSFDPMAERHLGRPPATAFEQSILTAVAKVAETRGSIEPKAAISPSSSDREAELDPFRKVQPAILEHRVDPEDLFSNWVASAPPVPQKRRGLPPKPPTRRKPEVPEQEIAPKADSGKDDNSAALTATEGAAPLGAESNPAASETTKSDLPRELTDRPVAPSRVEPASSAGAAGSTAPLPAPPSKPPVTTFTAAPYGMWQVSMPTALAPMAGAKSPAPTKAATSPTRNAAPKQSNTKAPPDSVEPPASNTSAEPKSPTVASATADKVRPDPSKTGEIAPMARPTHRDASTSDAHRPGDFVASLQEKLQRAQRSRPAAPPPDTPEQMATPVPASAAPTTIPVQPDQQPPLIAPADRTKSESTFVQKPATTPAIASKPNAGSPSGGLRSKFRQWFTPASSSSDRRRATRRYVPGMVAHYFTGGAPKPKEVADISMSGMYLLTEDRWMPGTMIQMTLQKPCAQGEKKQSINVLSRIVRRGSDGVAAEFVMPEALSRISHDIQPSQATDKFALARFL